jgi:hypothetical protein
MEVFNFWLPNNDGILPNTSQYDVRLFLFQSMPTGYVEVVLKEFKVINLSKKQLPFAIRDFHKVIAVIDKCKLGSCAGYWEEFLEHFMLMCMMCFINLQLYINAYVCDTNILFLPLFFFVEAKNFLMVKM